MKRISLLVRSSNLFNLFGIRVTKFPFADVRLALPLKGPPHSIFHGGDSRGCESRVGSVFAISGNNTALGDAEDEEKEEEAEKGNEREREGPTVAAATAPRARSLASSEQSRGRRIAIARLLI